MTYGDKIRQMNDEQLAVLLSLIKDDGCNGCCSGSASLDFFRCDTVLDWIQLIKSDIRDGVTKYGIM